MLEELSWIYFMPLLVMVTIFFLKDEKLISKVSLSSSVATVLMTIFLWFDFAIHSFGFKEVHLGELTFRNNHFNIDLLFDHLSYLFAFLIGILSLVVITFSSRYLHREVGFKRFFTIINLFIFGLYLLSFAGTLDLFFSGWEIVGLSSFLLIGFYNERTRPVRNAFRIFTIYRICDIGLLLSAILIHHYLHLSDHFSTMSPPPSDGTHIPSWVSSALPLLLVMAAIGKSAQFPFINWPARAMEGPTPSSAIFYGGLSIHCGVVLLLRTFSLYQDNTLVRILIGCIGFLSFILAREIGKRQSNIKGQLAYAAVSQIGIMFIEISLGLIFLVYVHMFLHAVLRCYQILVSPSIVADHVFSESSTDLTKTNSGLRSTKWMTTLQSFALQEGFLSISERSFMPIPLIYLKVSFKKYQSIVLSSVLTLLILMLFVFIKYDNDGLYLVAHVLGAIDLILCLYCFTSEASTKRIWNIFLLSILAFISSNALITGTTSGSIWLYAFGAFPSWLLGKVALQLVPNVPMFRYNGLFRHYPLSYYLFLLAFIGLSGYPLTSIFWAEDLLFAELLDKAPVLLVLSVMSLSFNGFICARLLAKIYWGFPSLEKI